MRSDFMSSDRARGKIQDILTDNGLNEIYVEAANNFEEWTVIEEDDITILEDVEALWQAIVGVLKTPQGKIDGVGLETYGSKLLTLRGMNLNYHISELAKVYIKNTIPQFQGYVIDFTHIKVSQPRNTPKSRATMRIDLEVKSVFGNFTRTLYI